MGDRPNRRYHICRIGWAQGQLCTWQSPRAGRGGEPQRVEVFENHPEILCKMAATWRCLAVDCGLDRRCHGGDIEAIRPACSLCSAAIASSG
jgi:hypothetical protein